MCKEWEGDVEEDVVLGWGLIQSGFLHYQSKGGEDAPHHKLKEKRLAPEKHIECLTIFPASLSNNSLKTFLSNSSLPSKDPSTTLTPPNPTLTVSSASDISSVPSTSSNTAGIASSTTAPSTIATEACLPAPSMPPMNPPPTAHPLPGSLVLVATSPFQSRNYSASPSPSPSTRTTPPLAYPGNLVRVTPPTLGPPPCRSSSTSHWGDCHPNQSGTPSQPPTWTHPCSAPLSMRSSKLRTAVISNISARLGPKPRNTRRWSTSSKKTSSSPSHISSTIRRPSSRLQMGMSLTIGSPRSLSPSERDPTSRPNGSSNSTMAVLQATASTTEQGTSPTSRRFTPPPRIPRLIQQKFFPSGSGKPSRARPYSIKSSDGLYGTLTTGGFTPKSSNTTSLTRTSSPSKPSSTSTTPLSPLPRMPDFSPLLGWKRCDFPNRFHIWQPQFGPRPTSRSKEPGRKDTDIHTRVECDVIDLTNEDSSGDDEEL